MARFAPKRAQVSNGGGKVGLWRDVGGGRPILVRSFDPAMPFEDAVKLLLVSFDSTIKVNLSVGALLDHQIIARDQFDVTHQRSIAADDLYFMSIASDWSDALKTALAALPDYSLI